MCHKEVDLSCRNFFSGHYQVAFVFTTFVINYNYKTAVLYIFNCLFNRAEFIVGGHILPASFG